MIAYNASNLTGLSYGSSTLPEKQIAAIQSIKRSIWLYFWLLIFEGALRKWVLPMLANPILLIRDPVVIWIYIQAYRSGLFPRNLFLRIGSLLAWVTFLAGLFVIQGNITNLLIPLYGFRTNFLHFPMIFIIQKFFDINDVRKVGRWILVLAIPMTLLMAAQFKAPTTAWINAGSDENFTQITTAGDHTRPPGTFSFITGPILFYGLAAAFLLENLFLRRVYTRRLVLGAAFAIGMAPFVSGSRSLVGSVGLVIACGVIAGTILIPRLLFRTVQAACIMLLVIMVLMQIPLVNEGTEVLSSRFEQGGGVQQGFFMRALEGAEISPQMIYETPLFGHGLGLGTNVGSTIDSGTRSGIMLGEGEWDRVFAESGPILGLGFILLRLYLLFKVLLGSLSSAKRGNILPFLLLGGCGIIILTGQLSQATSLGFAILGTGLCLAAMNDMYPESATTLGNP